MKRETCGQLRSAAAFLFVVFSRALPAQQTAQPPMAASQNDMSQMDMSHMAMGGPGTNEATAFLTSESSGTSFQPSAWPMPMLMTSVDDWQLMWMGQAFIADTQQSGPRGGDKFYSTNWGMLSATHRLGRGAVMLRAMLSLEPATVTGRRYPLLFQTGETAFGKPIVDGQHPHDLFMEISVQYAHPLSENSTWDVYYAPVGEPALGPTPYPHRTSAMEFPQATLGHHWEDSTHIANNVLTTGVTYRKVRLEASGFYGREPNENRWNIDFGRMDSWSTRLSFYPTPNWAAQVSTGLLHNPEAATPGDVLRTTASVEYITPRHGGNSWATSFVWGQDEKRNEARRVNAVLAETVYPIGRKNFLTGRYEWSQRDELFSNDPVAAQQAAEATAQEAFNVNALTLGYTRDIALVSKLESGLGANISTYVIDSALQPFYGSHPWGINVFARFRLKASH
jgi:hypothetical protein